MSPEQKMLVIVAALLVGAAIGVGIGIHAHRQGERDAAFLALFAGGLIGVIFAFSAASILTALDRAHESSTPTQQIVITVEVPAP